MRPVVVPTILCLLFTELIPRGAEAQTLAPRNPSFESGDGAPVGWTLSGCRGEWILGGGEGRRAVSVTGTGADEGAWHSDPLPFAPGALYRVTFLARSLGGRGGTPVSGPAFCNRDLGDLPAEWTRFDSFFAAPEGADRDAARLRLGQWRVTGAVAFDDVRVAGAQAIHARSGDIELGEGERLDGNAYSFEAPFESEGRNGSRPLRSYRGRFNTNRWVFGEGDEVVYRHVLPGRRWASGEIEVAVPWNVAGALEVSAGADGGDWIVLGRRAATGAWRLEIPGAVLPASEVRVRLRAVSTGAEAGPRPWLQVDAYAFRAAVDGPPLRARGSTRLVAVAAEDPRTRIRVEGLGEGVAGVRHEAVLLVANRSGKALRAKGRASVKSAGVELSDTAVDLELPPGESRARIPYFLPGTGRLLLELSLDGDVRFRAEAEFVANDLHSAAYGERLPASSDAVGLWWASSGWKIGRERPLPEAEGSAVRILAARNETEAAQAAVRPGRRLKAFTATPGALSGPGGASIPADRVEVLGVRYVEVTRPTDWSGAAAPWPDPLPPFRGPADLEAGLNHPLWIRVSVPRDAAPGAYSGSIDLRAEGWSAEIPLRVEVFGFALPDRMSCATAFGFDPGLVWRYQKLSTDAQRREVLEKYWRNFSAHRVSPYDPAPLDPYVVTWPGVSDWEGGTRVETEPRSGKSCLLAEDSSPTSQAGASCRTRVPIPPGGLRLRLWHRAEKGHAFLVTLGHLDAAGSWMPGRNNDMPVEGTGAWQRFDREVKSFPEGAKAVRLTLWAAAWKDDGSPTGKVWYDDVSLEDAGSGGNLIAGGDFEPVAPEDLKPSFDWSRWDAATRRAVDEYRFNSFCVHVPGLGGGTFHSRVEPSLLGFGEKTPEYAAAFGNYCRGLEGHLRENGWLDEAFVYWFDEPEPKDYAFVRNGFRKLKEAAPGIGRMLTEQPEEALFGGPDIWCPCTPAYDHEKAKARREAGDRVWWYVCTGPKAPWCTLFIDHPATELRVWLWQTWERKVQGVLVWQTNYWTSPSAYPDPARPQNPYEDPMGWVSGYDTPAGRRQPWGNGDGRFLYPPEAAADGNPPGPVLEGPVDSIRWEMLRDGIEDYEYLAILKRHVERLKPKLEPAEFRRLAELLAVPASITKSMTEFTKDPAPIEARRLEVARAIEALESR